MKPERQEDQEEMRRHQAQRTEKSAENQPHTADDLSVKRQRQVTQPGEQPDAHNTNGREPEGMPTLLTSDGKSGQSRDNDSDTANGLLRFGDSDDAEQTPQVTDKFMDESVKKQ